MSLLKLRSRFRGRNRNKGLPLKSIQVPGYCDLLIELIESIYIKMKPENKYFRTCFASSIVYLHYGLKVILGVQVPRETLFLREVRRRVSHSDLMRSRKYSHTSSIAQSPTKYSNTEVLDASGNAFRLFSLF